MHDACARAHSNLHRLSGPRAGVGFDPAALGRRDRSHRIGGGAGGVDSFAAGLYRGRRAIERVRSGIQVPGYVDRTSRFHVTYGQSLTATRNKRLVER